MTTTDTEEQLDQYAMQHARARVRHMSLPQELRADARYRLASIGYTLGNLVFSDGQESLDSVRRDMHSISKMARKYAGKEISVLRIFDEALGQYMANINGTQDIGCAEARQRLESVLQNKAASEGIMPIHKLREFVTQKISFGNSKQTLTQ